jgi:hypothetical protein
MGSANILQRKGASGKSFIRPEDAQLVETGAVQDIRCNLGDMLTGLLLQRSFQGHKYRYLVEVTESKRPIELTHPEKIPPGKQLTLFLPSHKCRTLQMEIFEEKGRDVLAI